MLVPIYRTTRHHIPEDYSLENSMISTGHEPVTTPYARAKFKNSWALKLD
jgi:hypothetical protein